MPTALILGMDFWNRFGIRATVCGITLSANTNPTIMSTLTESQKQRLAETVQSFPTSANKGRLGRTNIYFHKIDTGVAAPFKQEYYPMSKFVLDDLNKEVDRMLQLDIIDEAVCCPWNSATVAVKKKDG